MAATRLETGGRSLIDTNGREHGPFDLIIDATGLRSVLRREADPAVRERMFPWSALWAAVPLPASWPGAATLCQRYDNASIMIGVLPIGKQPGDDRNLAAFFWSLRGDTYDAWRAAGIETWRRHLLGIWPEIEPLIAGLRHPDDLTFATYSDLTLRTPVAERLAIIGDAAHCTSPQLGQGANLGLADAMTLASSLATQDSVSAALSIYATERRRHVRFYQFASRWLTPFFQSESRFASTIRDVTFGPMGRLPVLRNEMLATLAGIKTGFFTRLDPGASWCADYALKQPALRSPSAGRQSA